MMSNILLAFALLLMPQQQPAQALTKTDSVEMLIPKLDGFKKLDTMRWLAKQYRFTNTRKAIDINRQALAIARDKEIEYNKAKIYIELGVEHTVLSEHDLANAHYDTALMLSQNDDDLLGAIYTNKGILFTFKESFDEALEWQLKGLEIHERINDEDGIMRSYAGISWIYRSTLDYAKSLEYERKAYDLSLKLKDVQSQYTVLGNIANTLQIMHRNEEARDTNKKVIEYFERESSGSVLLGNNYFNMAKIYNNLGKWDSAYNYGMKAVDLFTEREAQRELAYTYPTTSRSSMALGKISQAEADALKGYKMNKELGRMEELEYNVFMLVKIYAYKHDIGLMDKYERELATVSDSIHRVAQSKALTEILTRYETAKKDHENDILKRDAELQEVRLSRSRYVAFSLLIGVGLLTLLALTLYQRNKQRKRFNKVLQNENEKLKVEMLVAQLNQLKDQINPHFLFNSLATLQSMAQENDPNTGLFVQKLSEVYRYILQTNSDSLVSLKDELKVAEAYMFMLNARFENALMMSVNISDELLSKKIPPFSLQLLVENAIKHNSATLNNPLRIEIIGKSYEVIVRNNIQPKRSTVESTKIGLANLQKRFALLGSMSVSIEHRAADFTVRLPLFD